MQLMVASPFVQALEALTPKHFAVWALHFLVAVAFAVAADLVHCPALNDHAAIMDCL